MWPAVFLAQDRVSPPSCPGPRLHTCPRSKERMTAGSKGTSQKLQGLKQMELRFGEVGSAGVPLSVTPGRLVSGCSWVSGCPSFCWQLVGPSGPYYRHSVGDISLPITPKTITPLSFPGQIGNAGFRKTGAVDSGRILGGDQEGLAGTVGRRECLPLFPRAGGLCPHPPDVRTPPCLSACRGHACTLL